MDIYKLLPGTNCKKCGVMTCLAFAMMLSQEEIDVMGCQEIFLAEHTGKRGELFTLSIWILAGLALGLSLVKSRETTAGSLLAAWKFFRSMTLPVLATLWAIGFLLTFLLPQLISWAVGQNSGWQGVVLAALFGSIVLIQSFIAFTLAGSILRQRASVSAIAAFVTTLVKAETS